MVDLTVIILTHNEELHLERALLSVKGFAKEVFIVDSYSTDRTCEIAAKLGATVIQHEFVNYAKQFDWALCNASISTQWVMRLDADEIVEADLAEEIQKKLPNLGRDVVGINLKRKHIFMGKWIRHGGRYPLVLLRIWRVGCGRIEDRWMDEHIIVWGGKTVTFGGGFSDCNRKDLTFFVDKHNKYATREALDVLIQKHGLFARDEGVLSSLESTQAAQKRSIKERIYNKLPIWIGPVGYFVYRYFVQLGFLDGTAGLIYHFLQGGWYRFLVASKVVEFEGMLHGCRTVSEKLETLERITGHKLVQRPV